MISSNEIGFRCFISRFSSLPVIQVNVDIKILWKERLVFFCLKVRAAMQFTPESSGVLQIQKFHLSYNILLPRRADS